MWRLLTTCSYMCYHELTNVSHWGPCISTLCLIPDYDLFIGQNESIPCWRNASKLRAAMSKSPGQDMIGANTTPECSSEAFFTWEGLNFSVKFKKQFILICVYMSRKADWGSLWKRKKNKGRNENHVAIRVGVLCLEYTNPNMHTYTCIWHRSTGFLHVIILQNMVSKASRYSTVWMDHTIHTIPYGWASDSSFSLSK